jgi:hypothetical protein
MRSMTLHPSVDIQRLVKAGVLTKSMAYQFHPEATAFLSFSNRLIGRQMHAEISYDFTQADSQLFSLCVTEEADGEETEIVSMCKHISLEHLVKMGKGFLCYYASQKPKVAKPKSTVTIRVDDDLRQAFGEAAEATGESQAVILRQLMRYFVGTGPNPKLV